MGAMHVYGKLFQLRLTNT